MASLAGDAFNDVTTVDVDEKAVDRISRRVSRAAVGPAALDRVDEIHVLGRQADLPRGDARDVDQIGDDLRLYPRVALDHLEAEVVQLRTENGQLREQVARCLGEQRARR